MNGLLQDIRYTFRMLIRTPGFTSIAVLALALGIGANTAIFSVVNAVVLKPLPYHKPEQLVQLWMRFTNIGIPNDQNWVSAPEFVDLQQNRSLSYLAAISNGDHNLKIGGIPERVSGAQVSASFFPMLGVHAKLGRIFLPEEDHPGHEFVVLLSDSLWKRRFGADPGVAGRKLVMDGQSYQIAGVLPADFHLPEKAELWTPLAFAASDLTPNNRGNHGNQVIARIRDGVSYEQARADLDAVSQRIVEQHPEYPYRQFNFKVLMVPLLEQQIGDVKAALWILMGAVGLVLLIACANVANLLLVRASVREREIAVRQALGVGEWRLTRQLLTESVILSLVGGAAGVLLGYWMLRALIALSASSFPRIAETRMDVRVLVFAVLASLVTGIIFGLAPAFHASRRVTHESLKEGGRGGTSRGASQRLRSALVVAEVALSLALLVGAGLLIRSFLRLQDVEGGFHAEGVLTMRVGLPEQKYPKPENTIRFFRELLERVRAIPGVDAAGAVTGLPLTGSGWSGTARIDTQSVPEKDRSPEVDQRPVTKGYFEAMGIQLLEGRYFDDRDNENSQQVAIVDETMARTYWPGDTAIGKRIRTGGDQARWRTIVGVVRHVRYRTLESPSRTEFYWPYPQTPFALRTMRLAIHTTLDPHSVAGAVERQVQAIDPDQPADRVETMQELVADSMARRRLSTWLLGLFAGVALLLAALGIYGVVSYSVAQRSHEVGIRMALGASAGSVLRMVVGQSLWLTLTGVGVGVIASLGLTRMLSGLLFGVTATDPVTFLVVAAALMTIGAAASLVPAMRATTVDPVNALRQE
jgi:predicted permease